MQQVNSCWNWGVVSAFVLHFDAPLRLQGFELIKDVTLSECLLRLFLGVMLLFWLRELEGRCLADSLPLDLASPWLL